MVNIAQSRSPWMSWGSVGRLLIVRELLIRGSCRYTDIQNGLPGEFPTHTSWPSDFGEWRRPGIIYREARSAARCPTPSFI